MYNNNNNNIMYNICIPDAEISNQIKSSLFIHRIFRKLFRGVYSVNNKK